MSLHSWFAIVWVGSASLSLADSLPFTSLSYPGAVETVATGINDQGEIVGYWYDGIGGEGGFTYAHGQYMLFDAPGGGSMPNGINDKGEIVGQSGTGSFLYSGGVFSEIDIPGATFVDARGINDQGQIVGLYDENGGIYGFTDTAGIITTLAIPGAVQTNGFGINNQGVVVGPFVSAVSGENGFLYVDGIYINITLAGATNGTEPFGINDEGQIVGAYYNSSQHGYLETVNGYSLIDIPGATTGTVATGINNSGDIVGFYGVGDNTYGFLLPSPVPEPAMMPIVAIGLGVGLSCLRIPRKKSCATAELTGTR